ncbi:MAG: energy transducer TonB [Armatimonadetes bacterium]|nr:energy transducer TonB [Armatimonadota bacterium]
MRELDQPILRRYPREAEPSRFTLALALALALNVLWFSLLATPGRNVTVTVRHAMRLSALRPISQMASYAQPAVAALPTPAAAGAAASGGGRRWFGASASSSRRWAWWPSRGSGRGVAAAAGRPGAGQPTTGQPGAPGPASTWSGPLATGGVGVPMGAGPRVGGGDDRGGSGPGGYGSEPASVGVGGGRADVPGGSPLAFATSRAAGDGVLGLTASGGPEPTPTTSRGGGRPGPGGAVDIDIEPQPKPVPAAAPAPLPAAMTPRPEPAAQPQPRPEPRPEVRPEPTPEPKPEPKPEPRAEPKPKPDLPATPRLLGRATPSFPAVTKGGSVTIAIHVGASGEVSEVEVTSSSGISGVDSAARSAGRRFRFSRAENGKTFYQTFRYSPK